MVLLDSLLIFLAAYLLGSFPTAYLALQIFKKKDIRAEGSGNVGALNALRSSGSRVIGAAVLLVDLLKGLAGIYLLQHYIGTQFPGEFLTACGLVLGHNYPVWLRFNGGRGLAVTAGALLMINPLLVAIWAALWLVYFILLRKHIVANLVATFLLPLVVFFTHPFLFDDQILLMILPVCLIILLRHLERIPDVIQESFH